MELVDDILRRHGLDDSPSAPLAEQGQDFATYATRGYVVKVAHAERRDQVYTEALVAPAARAAGVRTPRLLAWARESDLAYSVWERAAGDLLGERRDPASWRSVGRDLARLHAMGPVADARGVLHKPDKRDARPHLYALPSPRRAFFAAWLDRLDRAPRAPPVVLHYDVHGGNVLIDAAGATTLIDWADAAWGDPAADFGSIPMPDIPHALDGYEEIASLGEGAEARLLRAAIGQSVRKLAYGWGEPLDWLMAWAQGDPEPRFRDHLEPRPP
jgi:aminoglycoside phosphotransferase (APT) family kinase protein